jgi:uncharacterized membrane protein
MSAAFSALTVIFAKVGVEGVDSDFATSAWMVVILAPIDKLSVVLVAVSGVLIAVGAMLVAFGG